ncbi:MAG TPA: hypothetical protein VF070_01170 [Streptosporangiaceae bacterium]
MSEGYWQRPGPLGAVSRYAVSRSAGPRFMRPRVAAVLAAAGTAALAGCGGGTGGGSASGASSAGMAAANAPSSYSLGQLREALLTTVNGARPAAAPQSGSYGSLPDIQASKQLMHGVTVKPAKCADATVTGFNSAQFARSPASAVTFSVGRDGVSEVIVAASPASATAALTAELPSGCAHYDATVDGRTFVYSIKQAPLSGIAEQARALNVKAAGYATVNAWSVVFRSSSFVGAVTIVGPDASESGAKVLAQDAYAKASESLH